MNFYQLQKTVHEWCRDRTSINDERIDAICYIAYESLDNSDLRVDALELSKTMLWLFAVDDIFDSNEYGMESVIHAERLLLGQPTSTSIDPGLSEKCCDTILIYSEMTRDIPHQLRSRCDFIYKRTIRGMVLEKTNAFESYDDYMAYAKYTVGIPIVLFSLLSKHYDIGLDGLELAGEIIRLLNDIRSYERDREDGKLSAIDLVGFKENKTAGIRCLIDAKIRELKILLGEENGDGVSELILKIIYLIEIFYEKHDFHEFKIP